MDIQKIKLTALRPHPQNPNTMTQPMLDKLTAHIKRHGHYEPIVVRPHPCEPDTYQILNGHHRKIVLENLGHDHADCVVWDINDDQALMLLATLNRLNGHDDPVKRSTLLRELNEKYQDQRRLLDQLPETRRQLEKLLDAADIPNLTPAPHPDTTPQAMTFFLNTQQKKTVQKALILLRHRQTHSLHITRGDLLANLAEDFIGQQTPHPQNNTQH